MSDWYIGIVVKHTNQDEQIMDGKARGLLSPAHMCNFIDDFCAEKKLSLETLIQIDSACRFLPDGYILIFGIEPSKKEKAELKAFLKIYGRILEGEDITEADKNYIQAYLDDREY